MTETFWQQKRKEGQAYSGRNEAGDIGVWITDSDARPGEYHWEIAWIKVLSPSENGGNHNVFMDATRDGNAVRGLIVDWGWEGMTPSQKRDIDQRPLYLNKPVVEFGGDIAPHAGQVVWGQIKNQPSQTFGGFDIRRHGPGGGLSWGHWSIYVLFKWAVKGVPVEPPSEKPVEPPMEPPVEPPTEPPTEPPVEPPTEPPQGPVDWDTFLRRANEIVVRHVNQVFEELRRL